MSPILDLSLEQLRSWMLDQGHQPYRAAQVRKWLFEKRADSWEQMTDLPGGLRKQLAAEFTIWSTEIAVHRKDADGTEKLLLTLADSKPRQSPCSSDAPLLVLPLGADSPPGPPPASSKGPLQVECVLLRDDKGHAGVCISTQVGLRDEVFLLRHGAGRLVSQPHQRRNPPTDAAAAAVACAERATQPHCLHGHGRAIGQSRSAHARFGRGLGEGWPGDRRAKITISTVGLPAGIRRLAAQNCPYYLAVSLHAPNDELRTQLMPTNRHIGIEAILAATDEYFEKTGRRVTFEYILLAGVNDGPTEARQLIAPLRGRPSLVNLIPYNPVRGVKYRTPRPAAVARFVALLEEGGLTVAIRYRKGRGSMRHAGNCGGPRRQAR